MTPEDQMLIERADAAIALGDRTGARGSRPENIYNVAAALRARISALSEEVEEARLQQKAWADKWDLTNSRAEAAEAKVKVLTDALRPFARHPLPSNKMVVRDFDRHGLRRMMSPMELACLAAARALETNNG